jgi:hypothetical protein
MKRLGLLCIVVPVALALSACGVTPEVVQGTVVSYSEETKTLVVKDEVAPHGEITFSLASAEIDAPSSPDDLVRVAYREEGGAAVADRVMNLTKQKAWQKGS